VGQLSLFKVLSGTITADDRLVNGRTGGDERLRTLFTLRGKEQAPMAKLSAGDIGGVSKLADSRAGDTLAPKGLPVSMPVNDRLVPQFGVAITPRTQADDDKLGSALNKLLAEDPSLRLDHVAETGQTILRGFGEMHVAVAIERLARKFGAHVDTGEVRVAFAKPSRVPPKLRAK
jgi:elongation factor G